MDTDTFESVYTTLLTLAFTCTLLIPCMMVSIRRNKERKLRDKVMRKAVQLLARCIKSAQEDVKLHGTHRIKKMLAYVYEELVGDATATKGLPDDYNISRRYDRYSGDLYMMATIMAYAAEAASLNRTAKELHILRDAI